MNFTSESDQQSPASMKAGLDICYRRYNVRRFVLSDPIQVLYRFSDPLQREVVALVASSISYGRVKGILNSIDFLLERFGDCPHEFLTTASEREVKGACSGFRHRFTGPDKMCRLLLGMKRLLDSHGSIGAFVESAHGAGKKTYERAMSALAEEVSGREGGIPHLLPAPSAGSACKRLCLFFRWMIREDNIDPGGWDSLGSGPLVVPLDVHMMRTCRMLGLIARKNADWKAALEVTEAFRRFVPEDPVRYDFALTRASMFKSPMLGQIGPYR